MLAVEERGTHNLNFFYSLLSSYKYYFFNYSYQTEDEDLKRALQLSLQGEFIRGNVENAL